MDLGLYELKYPVRRMISGLLPRLAHVSPNAISAAIVPVGAATAACLWLGAGGRPWLYLVAIALVFVRMFLGTLDGLVATHYGKASPQGEIVNRLAPELCDALYLAALVAVRPAWQLAGIGALALAWLTSFAGLVGAVNGKPTQSVGPAGPTDRLAALQVLLLLAFLSDTLGWGVDFVAVFLWWVVIGGALTVTLRLRRHLRSLAA
jgi:CDP-diacylglycerol--glycerol-3-phosphate 3-phosphatidyltransferase